MTPNQRLLKRYASLIANYGVGSLPAVLFLAQHPDPELARMARLADFMHRVLHDLGFRLIPMPVGVN